MTHAIHAGGCLCGACRFEAEGAPLAAGYCHCRMCQKSSGGPVQSWALFAPARFRWIAGAPATYRSSDRGSRDFCPVCGSQLAFRDADGVSLNTGCLDDPAAIPPRLHMWCESRVAWFETADALPRWPRDYG